MFSFFLFFSFSCTLFSTNKPCHPQCRRIILEYEGALYQVEVEVEVQVQVQYVSQSQ